MTYRDELEAARRRIEALEIELRASAPGHVPKTLELELARLRHVLEETRHVLDFERQQRALAERAVEDLPHLRRRVADDEQLLTKLRTQLERAWRDAKVTEPRLRELDALHHQARAHEERADRAEREAFRLRMRLALERVRDVVPAELGAELASGIDAVGARFGPQVWEALEPEAITDRLKELVVFGAHVVWPAKLGSPADKDALLAVLAEIGHALPMIDPWSFGPQLADAPGLRLRIRSIELRAAMKFASGPLHIVTLEADSGLTAAVR